MSKEEINEALDQLCLGHPFVYKKEEFRAVSWKNVYEKIMIIATPRTLQFSMEAVIDFLGEIEKLKNGNFSPPAKVFKRFEHKAELMSMEVEKVDYKTLSNGLSDAFIRVQEDETFLPKAKQMCDIVNSLVQIQRTQLEILKFTRKA